MKKRILAVFLTLVMALSLLPVNALAAGTDVDRNNWQFVFQRNSGQNVMAAVSGNGGYTLGDRPKSSCAPAEYTFYLEKIEGTTNIAGTDYYYNYRVYVKPNGATPWYLYVKNRSLSLTADINSASAFLVYSANIYKRGPGNEISSSSSPRLCLFYISGNKGKAVEYDSSGGRLDLCAQTDVNKYDRWCACEDAYDLSKTGELKPSSNVTYQWSGLNDVPAAGRPTLPTDETYEEGERVTFNPDRNDFDYDGYTYHLDRWDSEQVSIDNGTFTMPAKAVTVTGYWKKTAIPYSVDLSDTVFKKLENADKLDAGAEYTFTANVLNAEPTTDEDGYAVIDDTKVVATGTVTINNTTTAPAAFDFSTSSFNVSKNATGSFPTYYVVEVKGDDANWSMTPRFTS